MYVPLLIFSEYLSMLLEYSSTSNHNIHLFLVLLAEFNNFKFSDN